MSTRKTYWLDRATEQIRFGPDRKAVRQELESHLQDREEHYLARGMTDSEAAKAAVADMGDPEEVARELGRIHSPWWGWLWQGSRAALAWMLVMVIVTTFLELKPWGRLRPQFTPYQPRVGDIALHANEQTSETLAVWAPGGSIKLGGYRITTPAVYLERHNSFTHADGTVYDASYELTVWLKATTWRIWEPMAAEQFMILERGEVTDSDGFQYGWGSQYDHDVTRSLFCSTYSNPLSTWYHVNLDLPDEHVPDWVDIPIGYNGDVIRVNLQEGVLGQ